MAELEEQVTASNNPVQNPVQDPQGNAIQRIPIQDVSVVLKQGDALNDQNWQVWKEKMKHVLHLYGIEKYAYRLIPCPQDQEGSDMG